MSMKPVYIASSETEADIIKSLLLNAGIEAETSADDSGGMLPNLALSGGVGVLVDEDRETEAREVLEEYDRGETAIDEEQGG